MLALFAWLAGVGPAIGQELSYGDLPLGGRAVAFGGAFTALADDPSGLHYNPAGLVDIELDAIQIGTNFYGVEVRGGLGDAFGAVVDVERVASSLDIIPATAAGVNVWEREPDGRPRTVQGFGTFVPSSRSEQRSFIDRLSPDEAFPGCSRLAYERTLSDRRFLFGGGIGHRLDDRWSFGFSAFLVYRNLRDREEIGCSDEQGGRDGPAFSTADSRIGIDVLALRMSFGALARFDDGWRFGAVLTPPTARVYGQGNLRIRQARVLPESGRTEFVLRELDGLAADTEDGLSLRLGVAKKLSPESTFALDVVGYAPIRYQLLRLPPEDERLRSLVTLATRVQRQAVIDVAFGGELRPDPSWVLGAGVFTRFSSAPDIPERDGFDEDRLAKVDRIGATLLGGWFTEHNVTRLGFALTYGSGADVVPRYAGLAAVGGRNRYVRAEISEAAIWFFLSNTTRY